MSTSDPSDVSALLEKARLGQHDAIERLIAVAYPELRRIAAHYLRSERPDSRLPGAPPRQWPDTAPESS